MKATTEMSTLDRPRTTPLTDWRLFAAAGAAALATCSAADASIIYNSPNVDIKLNGHSGPNDTSNVRKTFSIGGQKATASLHRTFSSHGNLHTTAMLNPVFHTSSGIANAIVFAKSSLIRNTTRGSTGAGLANLRTVNGDDPFPFAIGVPGYAGFKLADGDLGWVEIEVESQYNDGHPDEFEVLNDGYNTDPGGPILAGGGLPTSVPEPSALGLLAMGSAGVLAWRRRRNALAAAAPAAD